MCVLQGGFASEVGQQSLVSVLSSCTPALRQLAVLLEQCGKVQGAAVGKVKAQQEPQVGVVALLYRIVGLGFDCCVGL
jgi:hypothetical protein